MERLERLEQAEQAEQAERAERLLWPADIQLLSFPLLAVCALRPLPLRASPAPLEGPREPAAPVTSHQRRPWRR